MSIRIWNARKSETVAVWTKHTSAVTQVLWSGEDDIISCSEDRNIKIWSMTDGLIKDLTPSHGH